MVLKKAHFYVFCFILSLKSKLIASDDNIFKCMKNPKAADDRKGHGRQVSFIVGLENKINYTDWMKARVDSEEGKMIYSHRMSVVGR